MVFQNLTNIENELKKSSGILEAKKKPYKGLSIDDIDFISEESLKRPKYYSKSHKKSKSLSIRIPDETIILKYIPKEPSIQKEALKNKEIEDPVRSGAEQNKQEKLDTLKVIKEENLEEEPDERPLLEIKKERTIKGSGNAKNEININKFLSKKAPPAKKQISTIQGLIKNVNQKILNNNNKEENGKGLVDPKLRPKSSLVNRTPDIKMNPNEKEVFVQKKEENGKLAFRDVKKTDEKREILLSCPTERSSSPPKDILLESILSPRMYNSGSKSPGENLGKVDPSKINRKFNAKIENILAKSSPKAYKSPQSSRTSQDASKLKFDCLSTKNSNKTESAHKSDFLKNESLLSSASTNSSENRISKFQVSSPSNKMRQVSNDRNKIFKEGEKIRIKSEEEEETKKFYFDELFINLDDFANFIAVEGFKVIMEKGKTYNQIYYYLFS